MRKDDELKSSEDLWNYTDESETTLWLRRDGNTVCVSLGNQYYVNGLNLSMGKSKELKEALEGMISLIESDEAW